MLRFLRDTPAGGVLLGPDRSLTMVELESHKMMPLFPLKLTPEKSALEFTSTSTPGPELPDTCPPRKSAYEFPSTRMPALRGSPLDPFPCTVFVPKKYP
jgi:hypothetical protein